MKKLLLAVLLVGGIAFAFSSDGASALQAYLLNSELRGESLDVDPGNRAGSVIPGKYIVEVAQGTNPTELAGNYDVIPEHVFDKAVSGFSGTLPPGLAAKLESDPSVISVVEDRVVSASHHRPGHDKGGDSGSGDSSQAIPSGLTRIGAEPGSVPYTGSGVGVAIVDSGVDSTHADLNVSPDCFVAPTEGSTCDDFLGHGTHVAGIVAALNNTQDTVGVAPDATIYSVRVLDNQGYGSDSSILAGLNWVLNNATSVSPNIKVVNMSLGRPGSVDDNPTLHTAVQNLVAAGITVVVSAGNDASRTVSQNIPAAYPEAMAIASTTAEDGQAARRGPCADITIVADSASYFTTDGIGVSISAPGERRENVKNSCTVSTEGILSLNIGGGTTRKSGTSMSAPYVTGVVALLAEKDSALSPADIRTAIEFGADRIGTAPVDGRTGSYTYDGVKEGILSAPGALN